MPPPDPVAPLLRLYVREGCHLCDEAITMIGAARHRAPPFELELVDIEADERLHRDYLERIPVAELDGREVFELIPDQDALIGALTQSGTFQP